MCVCVCACSTVEQYSETGHNLISAKTFPVSEEKIYTSLSFKIPTSAGDSQDNIASPSRHLSNWLITTYTGALLVDGLGGEHPALVAEQHVVKLQVPPIQNLLGLRSPGKEISCTSSLITNTQTSRCACF